eukprot:gene51366-62811_t
MLRQSFNATGVAALVITTQPTSQSAVTGTTANFSVVASGTSTVTYQWRKAGFNILGNLSATTSTLTLTNVQAADAANYDVVVTNLAGSVPSNTVTLTVTTATPVITNAPLTAAGTVDAGHGVVAFGDVGVGEDVLELGVQREVEREGLVLFAAPDGLGALGDEGAVAFLAGGE